jgi:predicted RNase H-like nuclease (RuvC/YqgF family)
MARKSAPPPEEQFTDDQDLLQPTPADGAGSGNANEIDMNIQRAEEQLLDLKRQQEEIERQKRELDELSRKRREFDDGRREIVEKLTRGLVLLEREEFEVKRELEQIKLVRDSFTEHLSQTENLNPADWAPHEMPNELTRALARVDQAKAIYSQSKARLLALRQSEEGQAGDLVTDLAPEGQPIVYEKSFGGMIREGFAYSIVPVLLLTFILLLGYFLIHSH